MRKIITIIIILNMALAVFLGGMYYLSETYPFYPGDPLYGIQDLAEKSRLTLSERGEDEVRFTLALAERRLSGLAHAQNPAQIQSAAIEFDEALTTVLAYTEGLSPADEAMVMGEFDNLLKQAELVVFSIDETCCETINVLHSRLTILLSVDEPNEVQPETVQAVATAPEEISAMSISFLGQEVDHNVYPLDGGHESATCESCHADGQYVGTTSECSDCHVYEPVVEVSGDVFPVSYRQENETDPKLNYPEHFEGACQDCHDESSWEPVRFDHVGVIECYSCHQSETALANQGSLTHGLYPESLCMDCHQDTEDWTEIALDHEMVAEDSCESCHGPQTPERHYMGDCQQCHIDTGDWENYVFFHMGYEGCRTCHAGPEGHYGENCTSCHYSTRSWSYAAFDHTGFKDCKSCHKGDDPKGHYDGQCSKCHNTQDWEKGTFNHDVYSGYDCSRCHLEDSPAAHYQECSRCHNTQEWSGINVHHSELTECLECHSGEAPAGHYEGECSKCHNSTSWEQWDFDHTGYTECAECHGDITPEGHYGEECSRCHSTEDWSKIDFDHTGYPDCFECHTDDAPLDHFVGQCSNCHSTETWQGAEFSHVGVDNCTGCHSGDAPDGHWPGQCSNCHKSTKDWSVIVFDHDSDYKDCRSCHYNDVPDPEDVPDHPSRGQCSKCHNTTTWVIAPPPDISDLLRLLGLGELLPVETPEVFQYVTPVVQSTPEPDDDGEETGPVSTPSPESTDTPEPTDDGEVFITPVVRETETP